MQSIPRRDTPSLPNFCNLGVALRVLLLGNMGLVLSALIATQPMTLAGWFERIVVAAAIVEPILIASLVVLCPVSRWMKPFGYWRSVAVALLIEVAITIGYGTLVNRIDREVDAAGMAREIASVLAATGLMLAYFRLRERAFSPAVTEARLMALQARIRPHFLFNSLTAVLSLMRSEPRRAERALEDLADLFRALLREERRVVRLEDEIGLCRRYLDIEMLRLGDRLAVDWRVDDAMLEVAVPPLMLQPLVENAVHHGIEPQSEAGTVHIKIGARGKQMEIEITNPRVEGNTQPPGRTGNHMALDNVRERLALLFDLEARLETSIEPTSYTVRITLPAITISEMRKAPR